MPISDDEWDTGSATRGTAASTRPVGEDETEKDLIVAFLSENVDNAYTRAEIFRGVDFDNDAPPETVREALTEIQDELVDLAGDIVASDRLVDDVSEALDQLVADGLVAEKPIDTSESEATYYRLNTNDTHD